MNKIILIIGIFFITIFPVNALVTLQAGSPISAQTFNQNIQELNSLLQAKGFSLRFTPAIQGQVIDLAVLNNDFNRINPLLLYTTPLASMVEPANKIIKASILNTKFLELSLAISPLTCQNRTDSISNRYSRSSVASYTFISDYYSSSSVSVFAARGWPNVTGLGTVSVFNPLGGLVWSESYNMGTSGGTSATKTIVIPTQYHRKGYYVNSSFSSNNALIGNAFHEINASVNYVCP